MDAAARVMSWCSGNPVEITKLRNSKKMDEMAGLTPTRVMSWCSGNPVEITKLRNSKKMDEMAGLTPTRVMSWCSGNPVEITKLRNQQLLATNDAAAVAGAKCKEFAPYLQIQSPQGIEAFWKKQAQSSPLFMLLPIILEYSVNLTSALPKEPTVLNKRICQNQPQTEQLLIQQEAIFWNGYDFACKGFIRCMNEVEMPFLNESPLYCNITWTEKTKSVLIAEGYHNWKVVALNGDEPTCCTLIPKKSLEGTWWTVYLHDDLSHRCFDANLSLMDVILINRMYFFKQ